MMTAYDKAVAAQSEAANPHETRMVSANAGSGKTRVLVDRVSRILLQGVEPEHILCLTYTKAAATEMQDRLYDKLGDWSILDETQLKAELRELLGRNYEDISLDIPLARRLFAKALETPEGLKVQTIHAFCERVLARFPIEAGIMPGFEPIEDVEVAQLSQEVREKILQMAMDHPEGEINQALQTLTMKMADQTLDDLLLRFAYQGDAVERWVAAGGVSALARHLGLKDGDTAETLAGQFWSETDRETLDAAVPILANGLKTDQTAASLMKESLAITDPLAAFHRYKNIYLTQAGTLRKSPITKRTMEATQDYFSADGAEAQRVFTFADKLKALQVLLLTKAVFILAQPYVALYAKAKRERRGLDFNDQILLVKDLLNNKAVSDWVRYKLDGGIEHILLDEAQDTSPEQWEIINSLSEAFLQDSPDRDPNKPRTLFAVGDEKQSIYGFQGAKPEQFLTEIQNRLVGEAKQVRMAMSFRSSQTVLDVVDAFLHAQGGRQAMFDAQNFPPASDIEPHVAFRGDVGRVELWPLSLKPEKGEEKEPWDTTPVDALGEGDEREVLAKELAAKIKTWLVKGEPIYDREMKTVRAMDAGDILILVRTRGGRNNSLYDAIIRHLKRQAIPIAGADRIKLADALIVRDLLALSRFTLLPSDDLSLAEVLKGPVFGLDDMDVLDLAKGRGQQNLWSAIRDRDENIARQLNHFIRLSQAHAPYEFYTAVLDSLDNSGESLRRKFYKRLGLEAREALDVFLTRAMDHQQKGVPSLQRFIRGFDDDAADVKRDMDAAKGQVRVMTVHGAKGLEAPVVFLPDTTQVPVFKETLVGLEEGYFLKPPAADLPDALLPFIEAGKARQDQEQLRLLYVALTRAESRLVICGHQIGSDDNPAKEGSWYNWMTRTFASLKTETIKTPFGDGLCFGTAPSAAQTIKKPEVRERKDIPGWALRPAPEDIRMRKRLSPSHLLAVSDAMPLAKDPLVGLSPMQRGTLIHQLLEILPNYPDEQRVDKAKAIIAGFITTTPDDEENILSEVFQILDNSDFAFLWVEGSRAEVNLAGCIKGLSYDVDFSAQIDRLCIVGDRVIIVDYKSNRNVPETEEAIDDIYWGQMAAYRALAQQAHPGKKVDCALLWTAGPKLMWLSSHKLDDALTMIAALPTFTIDADSRLL